MTAPDTDGVTDEENTMATCDIQPPTGIDHKHVVRSALTETLHVAFVAVVAVGTLAGAGIALWLLSALAHSSYGIYFGL
jgi:hypothetical protein